jgi:non-lysosomal glucosylceramidase
MAKRTGAPGIPYSERELFAVNPAHRYTGERLAEVAFPLGGIGTGTVSLGGCGQLRDWEIFNRPNKNTPAGINFFALWTKPANGKAAVKMLETAPLPPYGDAHGFLYTRLAGIPRMESLEFTGE